MGDKKSCHHCEIRHSNCHANCDIYKEFKIRYEKSKENRRRDLEKDSYKQRY